MLELQPDTPIKTVGNTGRPAHAAIRVDPPHAY